MHWKSDNRRMVIDETDKVIKNLFDNRQKIDIKII